MGVFPLWDGEAVFLPQNSDFSVSCQQVTAFPKAKQTEQNSVSSRLPSFKTFFIIFVFFCCSTNGLFLASFHVVKKKTGFCRKESFQEENTTG